MSCSGFSFPLEAGVEHRDLSHTCAVEGGMIPVPSPILLFTWPENSGTFTAVRLTWSVLDSCRKLSKIRICLFGSDH